MVEHIIRSAIETAGLDSTLRGYEAISGSNVRAYYVETHDGRRLLIKLAELTQRHPIESEAYGLSLLAQDHNTPVVPLIGHGECDEYYFLISEWIDSSDAAAGYQFGEKIAQMHSEHTRSQFGLDRDNFIGASPQSNTPTSSWTEFYAQQRLLPQARRAARNGYGVILNQVEKLCANLNEFLPSAPTASLIHGDLWAGNFLTDEDGTQWLIDPCVYYGDREAEFGIISIFGGFSQEFYDGYGNVSPFEAGFDERLPLYQLYHYLNHLNLFGRGYEATCHQIISLYC